MKCPYCQTDLVPGTIYGDRYRLKWMQGNDKLILGGWVKWNHLPIGTSGIFVGRSRVDADYCSKCQKLIVTWTGSSTLESYCVSKIASHFVWA